MPQRSARPCMGFGRRRNACPNLIKNSEKYCPECMLYVQKEARKYEQKRDESPERRFLHSTRWRRIAKAKLDQNPLCERCSTEIHPVGAILVHHKDHNSLNNPSDGSNWESLCNPCHELEHKTERWGR